MIPFFDAKREYKKLKKKIDKSVIDVMSSGKFILGEQGRNFEEKFSKYIGTKYGIGVNSGTDAIKIALKALGVGIGDEVITVSNTAIPTISAIRELGATPVFVDIKENFLMDEKLIERKITSKTKVILPVHLYGNVCDMPEIMRIARKHKLKVLEDCAQSHGSKIEEKSAGTFGDISAFSFYPTKNLGAYGDAGIILTSNKKLAEDCQSLRMYGTKGEYYSYIEGYNSRLDEVQAVILNIKLKHLDTSNKRRREIARHYVKNIKNSAVTLPQLGKPGEHTFHLFVIRVKNRRAFLSYLKKNDIGFGIHYKTPIHRQKAYNFLKYKKGSLPVTEKISGEIISLPIFPQLSKKELAYITDTINKFR